MPETFRRAEWPIDVRYIGTRIGTAIGRYRHGEPRIVTGTA